MILSLAMGPTGLAQRRAQILLDHATGALAQNRHLLQTALDQMDQGISVFDPTVPAQLLEYPVQAYP